MRLSSRRGFTLVELLIAVLLLDVGVLALVAATAIVVRRQSGTRREVEVRRIAANRIERLIAAPCVAVVGDSSTTSGFAEHWWVQPDHKRREIGDSLEWVVSGMSRHIVTRTSAACLP